MDDGADGFLVLLIVVAAAAVATVATVAHCCSLLFTVAHCCSLLWLLLLVDYSMVGADNRPGSHGYARVNIKKLKRNINKVTKKQMTKAEKKGE
jgi:hypothetical protein